MADLPVSWITHRVDVPNWLATGIGRIAVEWSDLEWQLEEIIRLLMNVEIAHGRIATTGMNIKTRRNVAKFLAHHHVRKAQLDPAILTTIRKLGNGIEKVEEHRNKVVHGLWGRLEGTWQLLRNSGSREVQDHGSIPRSVLPQREPITANELKFILTKITEFRDEAIALRSQLEGALPPSPHKSPRQMRQDYPSRARKKPATTTPPRSSTG